MGRRDNQRAIITPRRNEIRILIIIVGVLLIFGVVFLIFRLSRTENKPQTADSREVPTYPKKKTAPDQTHAFMDLAAELVVEKGIQVGKTFKINTDITTIGRPGSRQNDIPLLDETVSRKHASIVYDEEKDHYILVHEGATNPTRLNSQVVLKPRILQNDDLIRVGQTAFRFKMGK